MVLDMSNNNMSGEIPSWIGNMTDLTTLVLDNNSFKGKLPPEISQLSGMIFLDVSQNAQEHGVFRASTFAREHVYKIDTQRFS